MALPRFGPGLPKFNNIFRTLGYVKKGVEGSTETPSIPFAVAENIKHTFGNKAYLKEYVDAIDDNLGGLNPKHQAQLRGQLNALFNSPSDDTVRQLYESTLDFVKTERLSAQLSTGLPDKQNFRNAKTFAKLTLRSLEHGFRQGYRQFEQQAIKGLKQIGREASLAFDMAVKAPAKFEKAYGVSTEKLAAMIYDRGTQYGDPVVDNIVNVFRNLDDDFNKQLQQAGLFVRPSSHKFLPFTLSRENIELLGQDKVFKLLKDHTTLGEAKVKEVVMGIPGVAPAKQIISPEKRINGYIQALLRRSDTPLEGRATAIFKDQPIEFKSGSDMVEFHKAINPDEIAMNWMHQYFIYKQKLIRSSILQQNLGSRPSQTLAAAIDESRRFAKDVRPGKDNAYRALKRDIDTKLQLIAGRRFIDDTIMHNIGSVLNQAMSLVTAAPARSTIRNLFIDYEANALSMGKSLYNGESYLGGAAQRTFKNLSYLVKAIAKDSKAKEAINNILDIAGWANSFDGVMNSNLIAFEDIITTTGLQKAEMASTRLNDALAASQDTLFKWSGNHALLDFARARRFISIQQLFSNVFAHSNFADWTRSMTKSELNEMNFLFENFRIGPETFDLFKVVNKVRPPITNSTYQSLGFDAPPFFITKQSILDTPIEKFKPYMPQGMSPYTFRAEMANNWQKFIYNATTKNAPVPTIADSISAPMMFNMPSWATIPLRPFLKFADVAQAQFNDLAESISIAVYGRPTQFIGMDRSLLMWGKKLSQYTAFAAAAIWAKDLLNNRVPTDFTERQNAVRLMALTGFGGYPTMVAANAMGVFPTQGSSSVYASTPLGKGMQDIEGIIKGMRSRDPIGNTALAAHRANPYTRLWYTSGLVEYAINNIIMSPAEKARRYRNLEHYGKPYIF